MRKMITFMLNFLTFIFSIETTKNDFNIIKMEENLVFSSFEIGSLTL